MIEGSSTYRLTNHLHSSFFGTNDNLTTEEVAASKIKADLTEGYEAQRITIVGEIEGRRAIQSLSKGKTGMFYLTTSFIEYGGELRRTHISPRASLEKAEIVAESLFMHALVNIAKQRRSLEDQNIADM